jgi:hypothetical protein
MIAPFISFAQTDSCAFFGNRAIYPYYNPEPKNSKNFYTIKNDFRKIITAKTNFDGIISVIFFINYKGETGYYSTKLCDLNYQELPEANDIKELCSQVLTAVEQSGPWIAPVDDKNKTLNSRKFYSFRFNKGNLIEILPK